jgi:multiple sugar transport system substrate-binding protein
MLRRWKQAAFIVALAALVATVFGGAATVASAKTDGRATSTASKHFRIMGFGPGDEIANVRADTATEALARADADVANPSGGFDDQKFLAALASRDVPDIVYMDRKKIGSYAARGVLVPLNSCIKNQKLNISQYRKVSLASVTYKGRIYGIPEFTNPITIIGVNSVMRDGGVTAADLNTRNWTKLRNAAKKMYKTSDGKVTRIGFDPKLPEFFPLWAKSLGLNLLSKNGLRAFLNHPKAIQALTYAYQLIKDQGGFDRFNAFKQSWDFFGNKNQVDQAQVGAWPQESWYYAVLARTTKAELTGIPFRNKAGGQITYLQGNAWAIPKGSKLQGLACTWARVMTAPGTWLKAVKVRFDNQRRLNRPFTGTFTANRVADVKIFEDLYQSFGSKAYDDAVRLLVNVQKYGFEQPASPAGAEYYQAMQDGINRVLSGKQTPRAALNQAQREAQTAINKAKK